MHIEEQDGPKRDGRVRGINRIRKGVRSDFQQRVKAERRFYYITYLPQRNRALVAIQNGDEWSDLARDALRWSQRIVDDLLPIYTDDLWQPELSVDDSTALRFAPFGVEF